MGEKNKYRTNVLKITCFVFNNSTTLHSHPLYLIARILNYDYFGPKNSKITKVWKSNLNKFATGWLQFCSKQH